MDNDVAVEDFFGNQNEFSTRNKRKAQYDRQ